MSATDDIQDKVAAIKRRLRKRWERSWIAGTINDVSDAGTIEIIAGHTIIVLTMREQADQGVQPVLMAKPTLFQASRIDLRLRAVASWRCRNEGLGREENKKILLI